MAPDGSCPSCGRRIATVEAPPRAPWHFKLLVAALIVYLLWRAVQLVGWLL
jgi:hypothetical protein